MRRAAGVLLLGADGRVLFLRRAVGADHPRQWDFPGGGIEGGETPEHAAVRELAEECDIAAKPRHLAFWTRRIADDIDFTTFIVRGVEEFDPVLNDEHNQWLWADPRSPPRPLHPGCEVALAKLGWNELDVARALRDDDLHGPQDYENITLIALRITGTGVAFRHKWGEYVQRDPAMYLNSDFLERCNGLPVVMEHPDSSVLTSAEFRDRTIGTIMLAYVRGSEVWGIAKIYDATAAQMMKDEQLSTSPAVVWRDPDVNTKLETEDGETILIEGTPSLLDHLAVCRVGVWDKGGEPSGVESLNGDSIEQAEVRMDALLHAMDAVDDRLMTRQADALLRKLSA